MAILDGENLFYNGKALTNGNVDSDVLKVGPGDAGDPTILVLRVKGAGTGTFKTVLETSATENFASPKTLGTYDQVPLSVHLPRGNLGYLRIKGTSTYTKGTVTAGLVLDDNIDR
nr:MAG TPA: major capsid protein [Caudoviricetes sp.]